MKIHGSKKSLVSVQKALPVKVDYQSFLMFQFHINSEVVIFGVDPISLYFSENDHDCEIQRWPLDGNAQKRKLVEKII